MKRYITVVGMQYYYGSDMLEKTQEVLLKKDKDNEFDTEAIEARLEGLGRIGYVANSPRTVLGESISAGRLYDKMGDEMTARVLHILGSKVLCVVETQEPEPETVQ